MTNKVDVVIDGEIITLKSAEEPEYMQRLARYVDNKLSEIKSKSVTAAIDDRARTLLIALNVADDYFKVQEKFERLDSVHRRFVVEMGRMQEEITRLEKKYNDTHAELISVRAELTVTQTELDEFIKAFDDEESADPDNVIQLPKTARNNAENTEKRKAAL